MLLWGEDDPVAVMDIPDFLEGVMRGARLTRKTMERTSNKTKMRRRMESF